MDIQDVPAVVAVGSGKGGVGKTTVSTDLARAFRDEGYTVGLVDADVSTPNSPEVLGGEEVDLSGQRLATHDSLVPPTIEGIQLVSQGVTLPDDVPVLRDGTWRSEAVADYIENVEWADDTDVVVVDTPPGTGEELQVVVSAAEPDYGVVVTTPHPSAARDALKTHEFFKQTGTPHETVINMVAIPPEDVIAHITDAVDFTDVDGIGDAKSERLDELLREGVPHYKLFGYDGDSEAAPTEVLARVPYTPSYDRRRGEYGRVLERVEEITDSAEAAATPAAGQEGGE